MFYPKVIRKLEMPLPENPYGLFNSGLEVQTPEGCVMFAGDGLYGAMSDWGYTYWVALPEGYYNGSDVQEREAWARSYGIIGSPRRLTAEYLGLPAELGRIGDLRRFGAEAQEVVDAAKAYLAGEPEARERLLAAIEELS